MKKVVIDINLTKATSLWNIFLRRWDKQDNLPIMIKVDHVQMYFIPHLE